MGDEKNARKAQTMLPGGRIVERNWAAVERYQLFSRGFRDGAGGRSMKDAYKGLGAYEHGFSAGVLAAQTACAAYAAEIGYVPTILRVE